MNSQCQDGAYTDVLDATFVMVARDPENKRYHSSMIQSISQKLICGVSELMRIFFP